MMYVEFLRMRRALVIYGIVILANALLVATSLHFGSVSVDAGNTNMEKIHIPLTIVLTVAAFGSLIFGTIASSSLNRERETLALSWTRPISRERMGLTYVLVDLGAILAAFLITLVVGSLPLLTVGILNRVYVDEHAVGSLLLMLGVTLMWYGLVQAATSWYRGRAGLAVGLSWGLFIIVNFVAQRSGFGPIVQHVAAALDYLNPIAYISSYGFNNAGEALRATSSLMLPENVRVAMTWSIGIVACAVAIFAWKRAEA